MLRFGVLLVFYESAIQELLDHTIPERLRPFRTWSLSLSHAVTACFRPNYFKRKETTMNMPMSRNRMLVLGIGILGVGIAIGFYTCRAAQDTSAGNEMPPEPDPVSARIPKPDPKAFKSTSNLVFHEISWQYFRWLTEVVEGGDLRFETMYSDKAIQPEFKDDTNHVLGGVQQANSEGILVDANGRAVYTTMMINDVYRDFVLENKLYDAEALRSFPDTTDFPVGALSLKAAWKIVQDGEDVSKFYTTQAEIELLADNNGTIGIPANPKTQKDVTVALIGFHIAIVVEGHPEAIWATFEQVDNAPYVVAGQQPNKQVSEADFTFYPAGTNMSDCNQNGKPILTLNEATQELSPVTHVARQYRLGGGSSANQNNIDDLNAKIHSEMPRGSVWRNYFEVGAIWFVKTDALNPNWNPNTDKGLITGSTELSNATIETFTQNVASENECFSCHNTMSVATVPEGDEVLPGKNILTSHIILQNYLKDTKLKRK